MTQACADKCSSDGYSQGSSEFDNCMEECTSESFVNYVVKKHKKRNWSIIIIILIVLLLLTCK